MCLRGTARRDRTPTACKRWREEWWWKQGRDLPAAHPAICSSAALIFAHPPQDPAQGQAYSQHMLWLDQRQKTQDCSYTWNMPFHQFCNMSRERLIVKIQFFLSCCIEFGHSHCFFLFLACQFLEHSSSMCHHNYTASFQLKIGLSSGFEGWILHPELSHEGRDSILWTWWWLPNLLVFTMWIKIGVTL